MGVTKAPIPGASWRGRAPCGPAAAASRRPAAKPSYHAGDPPGRTSPRALHGTVRAALSLVGGARSEPRRWIGAAAIQRAAPTPPRRQPAEAQGWDGGPFMLNARTLTAATV